MLDVYSLYHHNPKSLWRGPLRRLAKQKPIQKHGPLAVEPAVVDPPPPVKRKRGRPPRVKPREQQ